MESHLNDLPITAGPPSRWYRLRKFARRHHTPVAAGLVVAAALLMSATAATLTVFSLRPTGTDEHAAGMVQRHVWDVPSNVSLAGTISLDGRYLSYVDWGAGNLGLRDLSDKSTRLLTSNTDWDTLEGWHESSAISGEGQWTAYSWYLAADKFYELRVIRRTGNDMRILYHDPNTYWIKPYAWSPDGQALLAYFSAGEKALIDERMKERYRRGRLVLVNVADGSIRVLQSWDTLAYPKTAVFSPDGSRVAYDLEQDENAHQAGHGDIFVYDLKTGQSSRRVSHPADDRLLGWTPREDQILFQSNRNASMGLWLLDLDDASDESTPVLLKQDFTGRPVGFTRNGSFYYGLSTTSNDVYLAQLDESGLNFVKKPQIISSRFVGSASMGVWSPDGKVLAYRVGRSGKRYSYMGRGDWVFSLYSLETGQERLLEPDPPFRSGFRLRGPQFSADGNSLLVHGVYLGQGPGLYQIDVQTGRTTLLRIPADEGLASGPWSADGRVLYFRRSESLIQYDPTTQEEKTLYQGPWNLSGMAVSTDGQRLACWRGPSSLVILPAAGGSPREVVRLTDDEQTGPHTFVTWMPDNQHLLFPKKGRELWRVNSQTGLQQQIGGPLEQLCHVDVHPDGRQLAFTLEQPGSELWVMEGFLPDP